RVGTAAFLRPVAVLQVACEWPRRPVARPAVSWRQSGAVEGATLPSEPPRTSRAAEGERHRSAPRFERGTHPAAGRSAHGAAEPKRYTANVTKIYTPRATWSRVKAAIQGANIVVYLDHNNNWPSMYRPWQPYTKDGFGLDPETGADGSKHTYYGEYYIGRDI